VLAGKGGVRVSLNGELIAMESFADYAALYLRKTGKRFE
jgi:hypothetical protein